MDALSQSMMNDDGEEGGDETDEADDEPVVDEDVCAPPPRLPEDEVTPHVVDEAAVFDSSDEDGTLMDRVRALGLVGDWPNARNVQILKTQKRGSQQLNVSRTISSESPMGKRAKVDAEELLK